MSFDLLDFVNQPSVEKIDLCRKDHLLSIAAQYKLSVPKYGVKKEIKQALSEGLIELGILISPAMTEVPSQDLLAPPGVSANPASPERTEEQAKLATPPGAQGKSDAAPQTLPRFKPFTPESQTSRSDAKLKVHLLRLQLEAQEKDKVRKADYDLWLEIRRLEMEAEKEIRLKQLEVEALKMSSGQKTHATKEIPKVSPERFDVSKHIALVPTFRETEVDSYFNTFEKVATALNWPRDMWPILLKCKLEGKAQEVVASLSLEQSMKYEVLKDTIVRAYELVPEAYRQKFRNHKKSSSQTYVEFAHEKGALFDKWCAANGVGDDYESLCELMLLEDFKNSLPERVIMFLNEEKVTSMSKAAVLADEFVLTHKNVFTNISHPYRPTALRSAQLDVILLSSINRMPRRKSWLASQMKVY
ncbi:hypothetical protein ACER0C_003590 [Sarotherodon galilaeus]